MRPAVRVRAAGVGIVLAALGTAAWLGVRASQQAAQRERGRSIFRGETMVPGRLEGHEVALPAMATRCSNCHEAMNPPPGAGAVPSRTYAAPLNRERLTTPRSRRGGPATAYDADRMCRVLRTGIDPAHIIVPTIMPRYEISPTQCADLWAYLQAR